MAAKALALKVKVYYLSMISLSLLLLISHTSLLNSFLKSVHTGSNPMKRSESLDFLSREIKGKVDPHRRVASPRNEQTNRSEMLNFLSEEFKRKAINVGLVNMNGLDKERENSIYTVGNATIVRFDRVSTELRWPDLFPEWIDEGEKNGLPKCPTIPMPRFENYGEFDAVVAHIPCEGEEKRGIRDVFRLQVHLVVANLVVRNGRRNGRTVVVLFVGSCGPMWEIFRCEDLVKRQGDLWVYKPELRRLKQKLLMPVGSCQLPMPAMNLGSGKIEYAISKLQQESFGHPKNAYVTVLHSSEAYVCGAIALAQSIIRTNSTTDLILLADKSLSQKSRRALKMAGWKIRNIERIRSPNAEKRAYNKWNYSKLRIWQLKDYDKIMFIDSDLIVLENLDRFFVMPQLSAVGNDGVLFNSGVMVTEPSDCMFNLLMENREQMISYNGGDQGYLNEVFTWWHRLPRKLNRLKAFKQGSSESSHELPNSFAIHYLGYKPWMCYRDYDCNWDSIKHQIFASDSAHRQWWDVYDFMPKRLHPFCALSTIMDSKLKRRRERARNASFADGHWRIKIKDPRRHH